ncbi:unnamed protein product [Didymodactylos carnosus]|uniref:GH18 domain-containing protein n=1 Tax=Didymodactylos carnosus TaxID=1234261 RepID=A0A814JA27_9BILA|nr:unnamed protein product [Didymodactylos carnosus]CAF3805347.1 unnamed protein product [Didymodactylos carnosus]
MAHPLIILGYFAAWSIYARNYFITDIPGDKITHINYGFANIGSDGLIAIGDSWADLEKAFPGDTWDQPLRGNFNQLSKLKEKWPHIKTLISVGGWTWSGKFSDVAVDQNARRKFAASCVDFVLSYGFDGVDLDWEYPVSGGLSTNIHRPADRENYVLLLEEIREQLNVAGLQNGKTYLLTIATGAGTERIADMDLKNMVKYLDWINVMTYDFHGGWDTITGHNAPMYMNPDDAAADVAPGYIKSRYNSHSAIQAYIAAGVPREKLLFGLGLYGRGWQGVKNNNNGLFQDASSQLPMGTWENGVFDYDDLKSKYMPTYGKYWDDKSKVPYLYNPSTGVWISYDDVSSFQIKNQYVLDERLGGAFFWEFSQDRNSELIGLTHQMLNQGIVPSTSKTSVPPTGATTVTPNLSTLSSTSSPSTTTNGGGIESPWQPNVSYKIGDKVLYGGKVYMCIQPHTSLEGWTPVAVSALWQPVS